jgi:hypothetical protein
MNISKDILEILEESDDDFEMFYTEPKELELYFQNLEEKNLNLISNTKERE